jgi:uncharacterized protein YndB with AHSA1/START domain
MDATRTTEATAERTSDRELTVTRIINGPARIVFDAWTRPELFKQWWTPKSFPITLLSCELDVRVGGGYRLEMGYQGSTMEFFGRYLEVAPPSRLVWTNDEDDAAPVTTVTFHETGGRTSVVVHERYPSKEALDEAIASGSSGMSAMPESLAQLDDLLATMDAGTASS